MSRLGPLTAGGVVHEVSARVLVQVALTPGLSGRALAEGAGLEQRATARALARFRDLGWVVVDGRGGHRLGEGPEVAWLVQVLATALPGVDRPTTGEDDPAGAAGEPGWLARVRRDAAGGGGGVRVPVVDEEAVPAPLARRVLAVRVRAAAHRVRELEVDLGRLRDGAPPQGRDPWAGLLARVARAGEALAAAAWFLDAAGCEEVFDQAGLRPAPTVPVALGWARGHLLGALAETGPGAGRPGEDDAVALLAGQVLGRVGREAQAVLAHLPACEVDTAGGERG